MFALLFPWMHLELISLHLPTGVKLLDPGLDLDTSLHWRPQEFMLNVHEAQKYVRHCLDFGEQFQKTSELAYYNQAGWEDFFSNSSMGIKNELDREISPESEKETRELRLLLRQAQMTLLLAWTREERILEMKSLQSGFEHNLQDFYENLGLGSEESGLFYSQGTISGDAAQDQELLLSWSKLLPWYLYLIQNRACLFVMDAHIKNEWEERGLKFESLPQDIYEQYLGEGRDNAVKKNMLWSRALGWELALHKKPVPRQEWLNLEYPVIFMERSG